MFLVIAGVRAHSHCGMNSMFFNNIAAWLVAVWYFTMTRFTQAMETSTAVLDLFDPDSGGVSPGSCQRGVTRPLQTRLIPPLRNTW